MHIYRKVIRQKNDKLSCLNWNLVKKYNILKYENLHQLGLIKFFTDFLVLEHLYNSIFWNLKDHFDSEFIGI